MLLTASIKQIQPTFPTGTSENGEFPWGAPSKKLNPGFLCCNNTDCVATTQIVLPQHKGQRVFGVGNPKKANSF